MATTELDPLFVKALKLLHSKSKDAGEQLKQMLEDVLAKKRGAMKEDDDSRDSKDAGRSSYMKKKQDMAAAETQRREAEKRNLEKLKFDITKLSSIAEPVPPKKIKLETPPEPRVDKEKEREKERERERERQKAKERQAEESRESKKEVKPVIDSDTDSEHEASMDADDFAFDMGISCIVCRMFDVSSGNQLIECQECHNLYHQECHRPPVTDQDVNDPRFVWYCSRCMKNIKKNMAQKPSKAKAPPVILPKETVAPKPKVQETPMLLPFKRMEPVKPSNKEFSTASKPLSGLAGLAASLSGSKMLQKPDKSALGSKPDLVKLGQSGASKFGKPNPGASLGTGGGKGLATLSKAAAAVSSSSAMATGKSSSSSTATVGGKSTAGTSMMNAEKRMQIMKKKAAAKRANMK